MKKVAHLRNTFLPLSETFIYDQIKYLTGFSSFVLTRSYLNKELFPLAEVYELPSRPEIFHYTFFRRSKFFEKIIKEKNPALIHAHYGIEGVYARPLKEKFKLPLIVSFYGHEITRLPKFTLYPPAWFNYWRYFDELKKDGDVFLPACEFLRKKLLAKGFPERKTITHYIGIDVDYIQGLPEIRREPKTILTVGRLVEKKGTEFLIRAMEIVLRKYPGARLVIVGDGFLRKKLELLAKDLRIARNIYFAGALTRDKVFEWMKKAGVFCLPSVTANDGDSEGSPGVIKEAGACGLPVVSTYHAGIPEIVLEGETGFLVPERNVSELAEKILLLLEDGTLREKFGRCGKDFVAERFDIKKKTRELEEIYRKLL